MCTRLFILRFCKFVVLCVFSKYVIERHHGYNKSFLWYGVSWKIPLWIIISAMVFPPFHFFLAFMIRFMILSYVFSALLSMSVGQHHIICGILCVLSADFDWAIYFFCAVRILGRLDISIYFAGEDSLGGSSIRLFLFSWRASLSWMDVTVFFYSAPCIPSWPGIFPFSAFLSVDQNESRRMFALVRSSSTHENFFILFVHSAFLLYSFCFPILLK